MSDILHKEIGKNVMMMMEGMDWKGKGTVQRNMNKVSCVASHLESHLDIGPPGRCRRWGAGLDIRRRKRMIPCVAKERTASHSRVLTDCHLEAVERERERDSREREGQQKTCYAILHAFSYIRR